jgi:hypothetical protein
MKLLRLCESIYSFIHSDFLYNSYLNFIFCTALLKLVTILIGYLFDLFKNLFINEIVFKILN